MCSKAEETAPKIGQIAALHATDGFRAHGNLTPSTDGGSLQRKCFKVGVLNFALFNMEGRGRAALAKVLSSARPEQLIGGTGRGGRAQPRGQAAESTPFSPFGVGKQLHAAASPSTHPHPHPPQDAPGRPRLQEPVPRRTPHSRERAAAAQHGFRVGARAPRRPRCRERVRAGGGRGHKAQVGAEEGARGAGAGRAP